MSTKPLVVLAGATGTLGKLMVPELVSRGALVKAIVRPSTAASRTAPLTAHEGVTIVEADLLDTASLIKHMQGATTVVSTLQGLRDVLLTAQGSLLDAAVAAKVPRFIPSDYALDFTKTAVGSNRNLDIHREFHAKLEESGIAWTSVLNGAFMDMLAKEAPLVNMKSRKVIYVSNPEQKLDFTTMADTAAYTAAVATDPNPTPKILRIAGDSVSAKDLTEIAARADGSGNETPYALSWIGSVGMYRNMAWLMRKVIGGEDQQVPAWQGIQYLVNMFDGTGKLDPLDNDRYSGLKWTKVEDVLRESVKA